MVWFFAFTECMFASANTSVEAIHHKVFANDGQKELTDEDLVEVEKHFAIRGLMEDADVMVKAAEEEWERERRRRADA